MNKIDKLPQKDKVLLRDIVTNLRLRDKSLKIKKITSSDLYYIEKNIFTIVFHYDDLDNIIIDSIKIERLPENTISKVYS